MLFFPSPFLQEESSLGQASKEWCNLAQQSEVGIFCPFVVTASFCYLYMCRVAFTLFASSQ